MNNSPPNDLANRVIPNLPWSEVQDLLKKSQNSKEEVESFNGYLYRFVTNEANQPVILKSILEYLKVNDPQNATQEKARYIVNEMIAFSKIRVSEIEESKNKKK